MPQNKFRILLVDDNSTFVLPVLRCLSTSRKISTDVLVCSPRRPGFFRHSRYLRKLYWEKKEIGEEFEVLIRRYIEESGADLVIPAGEDVIRLFTEHRESITSLTRMQPVPELATLDMVTNKWELNRWLKEEHFPAPDSLMLSSHGINGDDARSIGFPMLFKPIRGRGGSGIRFVEHPDEFDGALKELAGKASAFIAQAYVKGYDIDISFFAVKGEIVFYTIQKGIVSGGFSHARGIAFLKNEAFLSQAKLIIQRLGFTGIAHLDFRYDQERDEYMLVDFNARYWTTLVGSRTNGVNFPLLVTEYCREGKVESPEYTSGYYFSTSAALKTAMGNLRRKSKIPVTFRNSQFCCSIRDPLPEIFMELERLKKGFSRRKAGS